MPSLKERIHAFRMPIRSRAGLFAMGCFYFVIPLVAGKLIMDATTTIAAENNGARGEKLLAAKAAWAAPVRAGAPAAAAPAAAAAAAARGAA